MLNSYFKHKIDPIFIWTHGFIVDVAFITYDYSKLLSYQNLNEAENDNVPFFHPGILVPVDKHQMSDISFQ